MSIDRNKVDVIDQAFSSSDIESFADLGGVWTVEGPFTHHALESIGRAASAV
jgi:hypothetical protein